VLDPESKHKHPKKRTRRRDTSPDDPVTAWAKAVQAGEVIAGPHVRKACARHLRDLETREKRGLVWDKDHVLDVLKFFPTVLCLAGGQFEGQPFDLHPSQAFVVGSLFGWKRKDGRRRFRRAYIEQGKGNGKSPLAAGIGMYCLVADGEQRAEVYAAASIKSQAMVLFRDAVAMYQQSAALNGVLTPSGGNPIWNLAYLRTGSFFRPISSEEDHSGPRPSCALCDEIHEHRNGHMIEMLERGFKFRRQPLLIMITNSGTNRNSVCWEEHEHAVKVAAGEIEDDETFSFVCSLDDSDDPLEDPACWQKANPLLGITITEDYLIGVVKQAKQLPGKLNNIMRLHFCRWTDSQEAWMSRETLEQAMVEFDPVQHSGEDVYIGLDLSATQDLTAIGYVVQTGVDAEKRPTFDAWIEAWTPEATVRERGLRDKAPYELWIDQGHLNATPGKVIGFDYVAARLAEASSLYSVKALAYDSYGFNKHFEPELDALGLTMPIVEHPQGGKKKGKTGLWMPGSKLTLESLILEKRIRIKRNPVLISAMMSAATENDPFGNFWFSKRKATNRIDALIALAMAVGAATVKAESVITPHYEMYVVG
jgi:phage terminase large subunit-like protein